MTLRLTDDARRDPSDIRSYSCRESGARQASVYMDRLKSGLKTQRQHPEIRFPIDHLKPGYRCFRVQRHAVSYDQTGEFIAVVAVLHESQIPTRHMEKRPED